MDRRGFLASLACLAPAAVVGRREIRLSDDAVTADEYADGRHVPADRSVTLTRIWANIFCDPCALDRGHGVRHVLREGVGRYRVYPRDTWPDPARTMTFLYPEAGTGAVPIAASSLRDDHLVVQIFDPGGAPLDADFGVQVIW